MFGVASAAELGQNSSMSIRPFLFLVLFAALPVRATLILGVDFGLGAGPGATTTGTTALESGFQGFYLPTNGGTGQHTLAYAGLSPTETTGGTISVTLQGEVSGTAGNIGGRDRLNPLDSGAFTYGDLLRDGVGRTKLTSAAGQFTLRLQGLLPNRDYDLRIWGPSSANDTTTTYTWHNTTGAASSVLGSFANGPTHPLVATANTDFSAFGRVTSSPTGELLLGLTSSNGSPSSGYVAAFQLDSVVPEPGTAGLFAVGLVALRARRAFAPR